MLQINDLQKSYGARVLFSQVSFTVSKGEIVGLVGRNGCGKSTLFKIIKGEEVADHGVINIPKSYRLGALDQHIRFTEKTVIQEACRALPAGQENDSYKAEALLFGLGFEQRDMDRSPSDFSGGFQLRINLVKCLLQEPDLLLLDEPTNYLDIPSLRWMQQFLKSFRGEVILITHDRHFMDSVVTHTMGIHRQALRKMPGNTSKYYEQLALDEEIYEKTRINQEKKVKEMQAFVDRFRAKNTKAKQAQSKLKQIQKMKPMLKLSAEDQLGFRFNYKDSPAKVLMTIEGLSFGYDPQKPLFRDLSFRLEPGDRIAVIGRNGYGKTTLLNAIAGQLGPSGHMSCHPDTTVAYYQQTNKKKLSPTAAIYEEIGSENPNLSNSQVRAICGAMMFSGDDAEKKIAVLSGGEQGRVLLGKVIAKASNVLLLDEPTNHLDMESIQALTEEIDEFPGGVIFVSHDEDLLDKIANKLIIFKEGQAHLFLGSYSEFLEKEGWGDESSSNEKSKKQPSMDKKELRRRKAELVQKRSQSLGPLKKEIEQLESSIIELESDLETKNNEVATSSLDSPETQKLFQVIGQIQMKVADQYQRLDELIAKQDQIQNQFDEKLNQLN
jgi:ATP-binding cassette, subfamily F, member 3